jgi:diguanylate cyclase (GGDEF)-like protein
MLTEYALNMFLVVISTLGFMSVYNQIDVGTRKRVVKQKTLNKFSLQYPQVIYIGSMLILLAFFMQGTHGTLDWVCRNLLIIIVIYSNLLFSSIWEFVIIQVIATGIFLVEAHVTLLTSGVFLLAALVVFSERWYGPKLVNRRFWYMLPPMIIGAAFWWANYVSDRNLSATAAGVNYLAFFWSYLALWDLDTYLAKDQRLLARLNHDVQYDGLTKARNWLTFQRDFNRAFQQQNPDHPLTIATFDIDHFKQINDAFGHLVGNQVLMTITVRIKHALHVTDDHYKLYRTGGDEFCMILPNVNSELASKVAQEAMAQLRRPILANGLKINITGSLGLALVDDADSSATAAYQRADEYLYQSKRLGPGNITINGKLQ